MEPSNSEDEHYSDHNRRPRRQAAVATKKKQAKRNVSRRKNYSSGDESDSDDEHKRCVLNVFSLSFVQKRSKCVFFVCFEWNCFENVNNLIEFIEVMWIGKFNYNQTNKIGLQHVEQQLPLVIRRLVKMKKLIPRI